VKFSDFFIAAGSIASALRTIGDGLASLEGGLGRSSAQRDAGPQFIDGDERPPAVTTRHHVGNKIEDRIKHIRQMVRRGVTDPKIREFAVRAVSSRCGTCPKCRAVNAMTAVKGGIVVKSSRKVVRGVPIDSNHWRCGRCNTISNFSDTVWCVPEKNWRLEAEAIFNVVRNNIRYAREGPDDTYQHPARTLEWGGGDCDDYTIVLCALLIVLGYPVKMRTMWLRDNRGKPHKSWGHIMMLVGLPPRAPTGWLPLDGSLGQPAGWYPSKHMIYKTRDFKV